MSSLVSAASLVVLALSFVLAVLPSQVSATCYMDQLTGYYNDSTNYQKYLFETVSFTGTSERVPNLNQWNTCGVKELCTYACQPNVVLNAQIYQLDSFTVTINGLTLLNDGSWTAITSSSQQPLYIGPTTRMPGTLTHFWTGTTSVQDHNTYNTYQIFYSQWKCGTHNNPYNFNVVDFKVNYSHAGCVVDYPFNITNNCPVAAPSSTVVPHHKSSSSSSTAGRAYSDPRIGGFWGQDVYVEGLAGEVYSLLSDEDVQVNVRFEKVHGADIHCPEHSVTPCFNHTGTYFGALAIQMAGGQRLRVESGEIHDGFKSVIVDETPITSSSLSPLHRLRKMLGFSSPPPAFSVEQVSYRELRVTAGLYTIDVVNMDQYVDVAAVRVSCWKCMEKAQPEGLLGRTWRMDADLPTDDTAVDAYRVPKANPFGCSSKDVVCKA